MAALPARTLGDEPPPRKRDDGRGHDEGHGRDEDRFNAETRPDLTANKAPPELTARALGIGAAIGAVLAAGNVYTGLKTGFIDSGALTATLVSFMTFAGLRRFGSRVLSPLENNVAQTVAASAAVMAFVHGFTGPIPALGLLGRAPGSPLALWAWGLALGVLGVVVGLWSRRKLIIEENLPFPSGGATAELIRALHADDRASVRPGRLLAGAAVVAAATAWCRDGYAAWIPQAFYLPTTIFGLDAAALTAGVAVSPLLGATGVFIGLRGAATLAVTGAVAWMGVAPLLVRTHVVAEASYTALTGWLVWPAFGVMLGAGFAPLILDVRRNVTVLRRTLGDMTQTARAIASRRAATDTLAPAARRRQLGLGLALAAALGLLVVTAGSLGLSVTSTLAAAVVAVVLAGVCARAAGETDIAPVGNMGTLTQLLFARGGPVASILAGSVAAGNATQTCQTLWALKTGRAVRGSVRAQTLAQLAGVVVGSLVVVPCYLAVVRANPLGTERMPAVGALSWRATAEAVAGGLAGLPRHGLPVAIAACVVGFALTAANRTRAARFLPSPVAIGIALITPLSMSMMILLGAGAITLARRRIPSLADADAHALAAGALAGESLVGVVIAILCSLGLAL